MITPPEVLTIKQVKAWTGIGRSKIHGEMGAGRLRARKCGRRTLFLKEDVLLWLSSLPNAHGNKSQAG